MDKPLMADHGTRYRLVTTQHGQQHIGTMVLSLDEARDILDVEELLLSQSGWEIVNTKNGLYASKLVGQKRIRRMIQVRAYTPLEDVVQT